MDSNDDLSFASVLRLRTMPRGRPRGDMRARLADAAFELFVRKGYEGTSISDVEAAVGLKPGNGSFYRHYRTKDELLRAAIARKVDTCMHEVAQARDAMAMPADPRERVELGARLALADVRRFDPLFRLMLAERERVPQLEDTFAAALQSSEATDTWTNRADRMVIFSALVGFHYFGYVLPQAETVSDEEFIAALVNLMPDARPPGVKRGTAKTTRAPRGGGTAPGS